MTRQQVWFDEERPLGENDPLFEIKPGCHGLVHPVFLGESLLGTLTVGKSASRIPSIEHARQVFSAGDANVVGTFADYLAIQIVNTRLHEEQLSNRLTAHALGIARGIQQSLLPKSLPDISGFSLAGYCESAQQVGGDFYDVIKVSDSSLLLVIADVMGKGVPAAMFAVVLRTLLRAAPELNTDPAALLGRVNKLLFEELSGVDMFITAQLALVDRQAKTLTVASAGHCPLLLSDRHSGTVRSVAPEGMPLGILLSNEFKNEVISMPERWSLLMFTDGVTEGMQETANATAMDRLIDWFKQTATSTQTADELGNALISQLKQAQSEHTVNDDETFLVMCH
jgi:serine phosphatase RsbU (regulator of sigma subunit)